MPEPVDVNLPDRFKGAFPFCLGAPSFVYPAGWADNVEKLGPCFDAVELLLFESRADALPDSAEIERLAELAARFSIAYNVHLPSDVFPAHEDPAVASEAVRTLGNVIRRMSVLSPFGYTLHVPCGETGPAGVKHWRKRAKAALSGLLECGVPAKDVCVENLHYPFAWIGDIVREAGMSVCMDVGHLIQEGEDPAAFFDAHRDIITLIHLQGAVKGKDHLSLSRLETDIANSLSRRLHAYAGSVTLETFSADRLSRSLFVLAGWLLQSP